jgi:hypothetical protein
MGDENPSRDRKEAEPLDDRCPLNYVAFQRALAREAT